MKIVFLSRYSGRVSRGVETYVQELVVRLSKKHQVDVFSGNDSDSLSKVLKGNYDVVVATNGRLQSLKMSIGRLMGNYKLIIPGQSGVGRDDIWNIFITKPDVYVAITAYELKWARKWAWGSKTLEIPNGVDLQKFSPNGPKKKFNLKGKIVLSVGALEWYKRHNLAIEAVSRLKDVSLVVVGSGSEESSVQQLGDKLLGQDRFAIMHSDYAEVPSFYRGADLFTLPSWHHESFGIVYLEAMASNIPVVATDDPSRQEIVGDGGVLVDVENLSAYAQAIDQALQKDWGQKPLKQAEKFSWDIVAKMYNELLESFQK